MHIDIQYKPSNTCVKFELEAGEEITAESGSMIAMSPGLEVATTTHKKGKSGIGKAFLRMLAGESFFLNHYTSKTQSELWLSSPLQGDMINLKLDNQKVVVQASSFVAASDQVELKTGWQGFKSIFSGESLFWLEMIGSGDIVLSSFGTIYEVDVKDEYVVDTGHIVAFEETLSFEISKAGTSWVHSFLGGEGLTCRFKGSGKIWCQSHNPRDYGYALRAHLKVKRR